MTRRYTAAVIEATARALLAAAGLPGERAAIVASTLTEAELLGRGTHGLRLLDWYLRDLRAGAMSTSLELTVVRDEGAVLVWDGHMLPGPWLIHRALDES